MATGFTLGGFGEGFAPGFAAGANAFSGGQRNAILDAQQRAQEEQQKVQDAQKSISDMLNLAAQTAKAIADQGGDPSQVGQSASFQSLVQGAMRTASLTNGRIDPQAVAAQFQTILQRPPVPEQKALRSIPGPDISSPEQPVVFGSRTGQVTPVGVTPQPAAPAGPAAPVPGTPNARVAQAFGDLSVPSVPSSAAPAPTSPEQQRQAQIDYLAQQLIAGNEGVLRGLPYRGKQGDLRAAVRLRAAQMAADQGISPDQLNANVADFMGLRAGGSALGRREAGVVGAIMGAAKTIPRVTETSSAVDRTEYPDINRIIMAGKERTGDPNVVRFGIAVNTLINNYARALGAGNAVLTDSARNEAIRNLQLAWSKGQINAATDQMMKELQSELEGAHEARSIFTSGKAMKEAIKPEQPAAPATGGGWSIQRIQ